MSSLKRNRFKIIIALFIFAACIILTVISSFSNGGVYVKEWNNFYDGDNIVFYYQDGESEKLTLLDKECKIKETFDTEKYADENDKVLAAVKAASDKFIPADIQNTKLTNGYDILERKSQSNKSSTYDIGIVARDYLSVLGIKSRVGVFRTGDTKSKSDVEYFVIEYWNTKDGKWVMVDIFDPGYFEYNDVKLSAVEVINSDINKIVYKGNDSQKDFKKKITKYTGSYTTALENSSDQIRNNCSVTYIRDDAAVEYKIQDKFKRPTIFTKNPQLFERSPYNNLLKKDNIARLLICPPKNGDDVSEEEAKERKNKEIIYLAAYENGSILKEFYLNINGEGFHKVEKGEEVVLEKGENKFELSLDGNAAVADIILVKK